MISVQAIWVLRKQISIQRSILYIQRISAIVLRIFEIFLVGTVPVVENELSLPDITFLIFLKV